MNSEKNQATPLMKEKKALRALAFKIKHIPARYADGNGQISQEKITLELIEYYKLHI